MKREHPPSTTRENTSLRAEHAHSLRKHAHFRVVHIPGHSVRFTFIVLEIGRLAPSFLARGILAWLCPSADVSLLYAESL